jgi:two-component system, response regulator PdtaR
MVGKMRRPADPGRRMRPTQLSRGSVTGKFGVGMGYRSPGRHEGKDQQSVAGGSVAACGRSVLVVDDEFLIAELLSNLMQDMGLKVCGIAATADQAVAMAKAHLPDLVLMEVRLKGASDGIEAAQAIRGVTGAPVIFVTASGEPATVARIQQSHQAAVVHKPIRFDQLRRAVLAAMA